MERDVPILRNKWIELYFGLFGPCLTYHTNGCNDDNARLVISLIFMEIYITLPWKIRSKKRYDFYGVYGFYTASEPDRIIFCWDEKVRYFCMPWVVRIKDSWYIDKNETTTSPKPIMYTYSDKWHGEFNYWIEHVTYRRVIWGNISLFDKYEYRVTTDYKLNSGEYLNFYTNNRICIPEHIELHLIMEENGGIDTY